MYSRSAQELIERSERLMAEGERLSAEFQQVLRECWQLEDHYQRSRAWNSASTTPLNDGEE